MKKRDPVTQACFINVYAQHNSPDILHRYWQDVAKSLKVKLLKAADGESY